MDIGKVFGERLLKLREERKETQEQLAKAVNITRQSLSRYETNERTPNIELIYSIAQHYDVSADYLLGLSEVTSLDNRIQAACEVTGLSEKAIAAICCTTNQPYKETATNSLRESENELQKVFFHFESLSLEMKEISFLFFEKGLFSKALLHLAESAQTLKKYKIKLDELLKDPSMAYYYENFEVIKKALDDHAQDDRFETGYKVPLLEFYEELSKFVKDYVNERMSEEASDDGEHNPPTE